MDDDTTLPDLWVVATIVASVLIIVRRMYPMLILALATGATAELLFVSESEARNLVFVATLVCAFTVASTSPRRLAVAAGAGSAATLLVVAVIALPDGWLSGENISIVAWMGMAVAAGDATRSRREYVAAVEERPADPSPAVSS